MKITTGSCECGVVQFELSGKLRPSIACHCIQCRKSTGHYWSATQVPSANLTITKDNGLKWYRSSNTAKRAFCKECGSSLFWQLDGEDAISVGSGTIDGPTGITEGKHIYAKDKGDYYELPQDVEVKQEW